MSKSSVEGKVAIVTGAASGIGFAAAKTLLEAGALGVTFVDLNANALESAIATLSEDLRVRALAVSGDVGADDTAKNYTSQTIAKWGKLDISVQCAGISMKRTPILEQNGAEHLDKLWRVNVRGVFLGVQESLKAMLGSPSGGKGSSIVIVSSQIGLDGFPGLAPYASTKYAVRGLMSSAAQEVGPLGIRVNAVCPGPVETPLFNVPPEIAQPHIDKCNLKRVGQPEEIAQAILFLASPAGSNCSGTTLKCDGGWSSWS